MSLATGRSYSSFIIDEFKNNLLNPIFFGFIGILMIFIAYMFYLPIDDKGSPGKELVFQIFTTAGFLISIMFAYLTTRSFGKEFEKKTINILLTTPLSRNKIFFGKLLSISLLIPIVLAILGLGFILIIYVVARLPMIELIFILFRMLIIALLFLSIISFSIIISLVTRKSAASLTLVILYLTLTIPLGIGFGLSINGSIVTPRYDILFLFPSSLFTAVLLQISEMIQIDWIMVLTQMIFVSIFISTGLMVFRRSEIWG